MEFEENAMNTNQNKVARIVVVAALLAASVYLLALATLHSAEANSPVIMSLYEGDGGNLPQSAALR
jgi:hypothetical protein